MMKKKLEGRLKVYGLEDGSTLLEVGGELLVHIPPGVEARNLSPSSPRSGVVLSCDIQEGTTRKGRKILRLIPGDKYCVTWDWGKGFREWFGWPDHPEVLAWVGSTSGPRPRWWEVWIFPSRLRKCYGGTLRPDPEKIRAEIREETREEIDI